MRLLETLSWGALGIPKLELLCLLNSSHILELIKEGYIWRIGDGTGVNIWSDPWIPRAWSRRVITPKGQNLITQVSELICPITGAWDEQLVKDTFWPDDV